jgi:hypothetical protein
MKKKRASRFFFLRRGRSGIPVYPQKQTTGEIDRDPVCGYAGVIGDSCPKCGRTEKDGPGFESKTPVDTAQKRNGDNAVFLFGQRAFSLEAWISGIPRTHLSQS